MPDERLAKNVYQNDDIGYQECWVRLLVVQFTCVVGGEDGSVYKGRSG